MAKITASIMRLILFISLIFFIAIAFDVTPYLRGPAPYPPDWRWEYLFINTFHKIWIPLSVIFLMLYITSSFLNKPQKQVNESKMLATFIILGFLFQLSVLYFSRSGISVLLHRIINPDLNGYFTEALRITDVGVFLKEFNDKVLSLSQHAQGHPPGAILFFSLINSFSSLFPNLLSFTNQLIPRHEDVKIIWESLLPNQKLGALISSFCIPFLSLSAILPLYFVAKLIYGKIVAFRASLLYLFIPSIVLFTPLNDVFIPIFPTASFLLLLMGFKKQESMYFFLSGLVFIIGIFFSLSILPLLFIFATYSISQLLQNNTLSENSIIFGIYFTLGLFFFPFVLFANYGFNFYEVSITIMKGLPEMRSYTTWIFYNFYDFLIFLGVPLLIMIFIMIKRQIQILKKKEYKKLDIFFLSFLVMLFIVDLSGTVRGEVARIWIPFIPFIIIPLARFTTKELRLSNGQFLIILFLQAAQILAMQEFWVTLW